MTEKTEKKTKRKQWHVRVEYDTGAAVSQIITAGMLVPYVREKGLTVRHGSDRVNSYVIPYVLENGTAVVGGKLKCIAVQEKEIPNE